MANTNRAVDLLGVDFDKRDTTPEFEVGYSVFCSAGDVAQYVQASGAIAASQTDIAVDAAGQASDGLGTWECSLAFVDNEYGWVRKNFASLTPA
jgi:hypothetical protein